MQRTTRYVAVLATLLAALAVGCAETTAPSHDSPCSGGGTETWDICGSTNPPPPSTPNTVRADTTLVVKP